MLRQKMIQEIQELKKCGFTVAEIAEHFKKTRGAKAPTLPTIRKYYQMDAAPDRPSDSVKKEKSFDREPYRDAIIAILERNSRCCISSIYDVLEEKYVEGRDGERLPGNQQTLRNYVKHLRESGAVHEEEGGRIYEHVFDTPPGQQMLLDFGQERINAGLTVHFICMLLRYSRLFCVFAQDHKFNAEEACQAMYRGFVKFGGRPGTVVIDQDAVFVATETFGEVVLTHVFEAFCSEQGLELWVCNKNDPESKGPVENLVGFVKKNYFSARDIDCIEYVWGSLPSWVERKNKRIHQATFRVPAEVFAQFEREALRPLLPSVYEKAPSSYTSVKIDSMPYLLYKSSKYSVPREYCHKDVLFKAVDGKLHVYDASRAHICTHDVSECKGSFNQLDEHKKDDSGDWLAVAERLRKKWNCIKFQHFINGFKKENPRHLRSQLRAIENLFDAENPPRKLVADVMEVCCQNYRYKYSQFRSVYELKKAGYASGPATQMDGAQRRSLDVYKKAFDERCAQQAPRMLEGGGVNGVTQEDENLG